MAEEFVEDAQDYGQTKILNSYLGRDTSRNALANGLYSIFSLVIWWEGLQIRVGYVLAPTVRTFSQGSLDHNQIKLEPPAICDPSISQNVRRLKSRFMSPRSPTNLLNLLKYISVVKSYSNPNQTINYH